MGLLCSLIGTDFLTGTRRFTFDEPSLLNGLPLLPVLVGIFALPEAVRLLTNGTTRALRAAPRSAIGYG